MATPKFTPAHERIVREGLDALAWLELVIERRIRRLGETDSLLLALRDVCGLAGRLSDSAPEEWRQGRVWSVLSPQDVWVLEGWEREAGRILHSAEDPAPKLSGRHPARLRRLRELLEQYLA
jgi:hypothetical protein